MPVVYILIVFLLSAGFAKSMAIWINWVCSLRIAKKIVIADKGLNLLLIGVYPICLTYGLGWQGARLLRGGSISQIDSLWWWPIGMGIFGVFALINSTIRYQRYRPPACELSTTSHLLDLRTGAGWRDKYVGYGGRMRPLALLPRNQQFTLEVCTKTYRLPRLPDHWDGLTIVHFSDTHFYKGVSRAYFEFVCEQAAMLKPDLYIFSGDLVDDPARIEWIPETLGTLRAPLGQYYVLGNHDWYLDPNASRRELEKFGWTDLSSDPAIMHHDQEPTAAPLVLCGDETPWMGTHADLSSCPHNAFRILVSHGPDNIGWARKHKIDLMLSGHTHGGQIRLPILGPVYSPSRYGCRFASGVFWLDPTLMYVSRGISGKEPIRYNCPPELTKLVLRSSGGTP